MLFKKKPISAEYTVYGCSLQIVANKGSIIKRMVGKVFLKRKEETYLIIVMDI